MMWSIAVCDDNRRQCRELAALLEIYGEENRIAVETEVFYDGCSLSKRMREGKRYDLIFLDVLMEGMDGIEVGNRIRRGIGDEEVQLVYMSRVRDHAELLFPNRPLGFLRKPLLREEIYRLTDYARKLGFQSQKFFLYHKGRILYQVAYKEIRYLPEFTDISKEYHALASEGLGCIDGTFYLLKRKYTETSFGYNLGGG